MSLKKVIVLATKNANKVREINNALNGSGIKVRPLTDFPAIPDIIEDGKTLEANALKKAENISKRLNCPALADDSGLFVPAINGLPGVKSARYAGPACDYDKNNKKLLKAMNGLKGQNRRAYFATMMALALPGKKSKYCMGKIWGRITTELVGQNGFGYDPIFIPRGYQLTFAQMKLKDKNKISHRVLALNKILSIIKKELTLD